MKYFLISSFLILVLNSCYAQQNVRDTTVNAGLFHFNYEYQIPGGDLAKRFGANSNLGFGYYYKYQRWQFGAEGNWLFGESVKEDSMLKQLITSGGNIIDFNGLFVDYVFQERGFHLSAKVGYVLPVIGPNPNCGIFFQVGGGLLQHKIKIQIDERDTPYLSKEYQKGYDRLSNGITLDQFIGYAHFSNRRLINFYTGFHFIQAFTTNRRTWNYDTNSEGEGTRTDLLFGIKFGWILPVYARAASEYYYH